MKHRLPIRGTAATLMLLMLACSATWIMASGASAQVAREAEAWGEPVEGIQLKLVLSDGPLQQGTSEVLPPLQIRFRNQGSLPATFVDAATMCLEIELDGVWRFPELCMQRLGSPPVSAIQIPAGGKSELLSFNLEHSLAVPAMQVRRQFDLKPGKHTIRVRAELADGDCGRIIDGRIAGGIGSPFCHDKTGKTVRVQTSKVIGVLTSNPVTFDFPVRADAATVIPPRCEGGRERRGEIVFGGMEHGETFTQTRNNFIGQPSDSGWILKLVPVGSGWLLQLAATGREGENIARLTPPLHGLNPLEILGWHFRNADNTTQNDGSVNAPGLVREFIFSPRVGKDIQGAAATSSPTREEIDAVRAFGRGWLIIDSYRLTRPKKGEQAAFDALTFHACLTWPR